LRSLCGLGGSSLEEVQKSQRSFVVTVTVCCLNWRNFLGHGEKYVERLHNGIKRHAGEADYTFRAFTETDLPGGAKGWWNKLALFEPGRFPRGARVVFIDLDTVITGPLEGILGYSGDLAYLSDFTDAADGASGVIAWEVSQETENIYLAWKLAGKPQFHPQGDGGWISAMMVDADRLQDLFPGQFVSFKKHCLLGVPDEASMVCFHGLPRPHVLGDLMDQWK
jgi:hypothetical protein